MRAMTPSEQAVADLLKSAAAGDREAARGLLHLIRDREISGRPLEPALRDWLSDGQRRVEAGECRTLDDALGLCIPAHRESTARDQLRARTVCQLMHGLTLEWERRTVRGELRYLSDRQAAAILAALSARKETLRDDLARILKRCSPSRRAELLDQFLKAPARPKWAGLRPKHAPPARIFADAVPRGLTLANIRRLFEAYGDKYQ